MSRWASQSSKLVAGRAERAAVGSTPILSRLKGYRTLCAIPFLELQMPWISPHFYEPK